MLRYLKFPWQAFMLLIIFGTLVTIKPGHCLESSTVQPASKNDIQELLSGIKKRQTSINEQAGSITKRLSTVKTDIEQKEQAEQLQAVLAIIDQLSIVYEQQTIALKLQQSLFDKKQHLQEQIADLKTVAAKKQKFSFMQLDQVREELNVESRREKTLAAKIELAETALNQATEVLQEQQDNIPEAEELSPPKTEKKASELVLENTHWQLELATQTQQLRQFELSNAQLEKTVYLVRLDYLNHQVEYFDKQAVFDRNELKEQLQRIDREEFDLRRSVTQAKNQLPGVRNRLEQIRKKLVSVTNFDEGKRLEAENDILQLKFDALNSKIDSGSRRIELFKDWKQVWEYRYQIFNQLAEQSMLPKWKEQALQQLEKIDQEQANLKLWLSDWQNRQLTLRNKAGDPKTASYAVSLQQESMRQIIDSLESLQTTLENSRRLHKKLIDEINTRTSNRTWREWGELALHYQFYQNTLLDWCHAFASAITTFLLLYFIRWILIYKLKHLEEPGKRGSLINGFLTSIKRANSFFFLMVAVWIASSFLTLSADTKTLIFNLTKVATVFQFAVWGSSFVRVWVFKILARRTKRDGASMGALSIFNFSSQIILWSITLLLILQNLGINVTALIAGLGIGGVAVALSLQRILGDLFSSLSIVLDKPFVVSDFVVFGDVFGSVEHIGIKTTRIRSLTGEQIICPNGDLLNTRIRNYKRMNERRVCFKIGVVYQTSAKKLQEIPQIIKEIIETQQSIRFDRAHFCSYGDFALLFEIVYYVLDPDYNLYMDLQQAINLEIFKRFQSEGIEFAYPTQSLYLQNIKNNNSS